MTTHSLADYCDEVARPGLMLAQKDAERGVLEEGKRKTLVDTIEVLFSDIAHENWLIRKEAHASVCAATKAPSAGDRQNVT
jgi:hypothetical protein